MIFHGYFRSSSAHRCRIALNLKGLEPEQKFHHLRRNGGEQKFPSYRDINPQALVPALQIPGGGQNGGELDLILTQSLAMIEWLDETYPEPWLLPENMDLRAQVRAFAQIIACDIHPLQNLRVLQFLQGELQLGQEQVDQWCRQWISDGLNACEALLARSDKRHTFCFGEQPGLADICLVPQVYSARRFKVDLSAMPYISSIFEICESLPAFQKARPSAQPDAEE